ncbi:polyprotein [Plakobranchus ocellatus]|uniref:Polyprotein n=1 Tax=Plakobranchus ocellatus TaxID=259542 RepID=A0AAV4ADZ4_9GAST|nr:polyprotein [Plakobranchus ocellatus]
MLRDSDLTLDKAIPLGRAEEKAKQQLAEMRETKVEAVKTAKRKDQRTKHKEYLCKRCGTRHEPKKCRAWGKVCKKCQKNNHFASQCKTKAIHDIAQSQEETSDSDEEFDIGSVTQENKDGSEVYYMANVEGIDVNFKIDTGAQVNILPYYLMKGMKHKLHQTKAKLNTYTGTAITVKGKTDLAVNGQKHEFFIVEDKHLTPILGYRSAKKLEIIKIMSVTIKEYPTVFGGLGCLKEPYKIQTDKEVKPVICPPRKIPVALQQKLKDKLTDMERKGVIKKVQVPTEWVNGLVIVEKQDSKDIQLCLDPRNLNKAIKREHHPLPTIEEIITRSTGAKVFSKLDANSGYWQIPLDEDSQLLTTFNTPQGRYCFTPQGRYCFTRMPFGITLAQEVFHKRIHEAFEDIEGVETDIDDILVWGKNTKEHDERLRKVLNRCRKINLTLNEKKCHFNEEEITYLGHKLTQDGVQPDKEKVKAITAMPPPEDKKGVERLLGTVNYMAKFIPNLSENY